MIIRAREIIMRAGERRAPETHTPVEIATDYKRHMKGVWGAAGSDERGAAGSDERGGYSGFRVR
jgi:hypothetical protein